MIFESSRLLTEKFVGGEGIKIGLKFLKNFQLGIFIATPIHVVNPPLILDI
jgi:hypothetical protein